MRSSRAGARPEPHGGAAVEAERGAQRGTPSRADRCRISIQETVHELLYVRDVERSLLVFLVSASLAAACGSSSSSSSPKDDGGRLDAQERADSGAHHDSGAPSRDSSPLPDGTDQDSSAPLSVPASCVMDAGVGRTAGYAVVSGAMVAATTCVDVYVESLPYPMGGGPYAFAVNSLDAVPHVTSPQDSSDALLDVFLQIAAESPGTYTSSVSNAAGYGTFTFNLPVPSWVECGGTTPPTCPPGCTTACAGGGGGPVDGGSPDGDVDTGGCLPCAPNPPTETFAAAQGSYATHAPSGSWTLTLTQASPVPHGSLTVALVGSETTSTNDAGPNPGNATLKVVF
jgi:hypothetical protein